ncbi:MAG: sulfate adenylyltransferase subunit CysN [Rudaea sp.]|uniref:sulfate adenylyltransferase subunit CysN n=1 Tax=unclassified Rudaea TaxID=2627037 RepID=UPI0010F6F25A|nr:MULTISPECIES: sulfate adenylyltransferase subunit CysN [unclassified Rudaea]MBN8888324.1 sulfate adenylyltransferase subunit CysN [Rudaea sp.]MBR0346746.1 sulfate adenylyltransferase subunit CysN [Rudaea sp.]
MNAAVLPPDRALIENDIEQYLRAHENKSLLRFITCGSVDDGKSTLIGRMLFDAKALLDDQLSALEADSKRVGTQGDDLDFALLVDGLSAEREQGITIDVAYRFFSTEKRKFIVADTPGHEQYTRNMITGASTADLAVILIDARKGVLTQTRRHSYLVSLVGIRHVVLAINKLDLVGYSQQRFDEIDREYRAFIERLNGSIEQVTSIPLSALRGDNISEASANTPWYTGPSLLEFLEDVPISASTVVAPLRMPVQWVNRPNLDFRGYSGRILGGAVKPGDAVRVLPSGKTSTVARIVSLDGDKAQAIEGESVTLTLADEIDISRGDVICAAQEPAGLADQFEATIAWMSEEAMLPGRSYLVKIGASTVGASISKPKYVVEVNTLDRLVAKTLNVNEVGVCTLTLDRAVAFDPYAENRDMGSFIVIDRLNNHTIAAGTLHFALRRSQNIHWQALEVDKSARARLNGHKPCVLWLTGLSGSGKSTIANLVERKLHALGVRTYLLDGDNVRHGLNKDLGFTAADRIENIRRIGEVAKLMVDAGLVVITAFISPFRSERKLARDMVNQGEFFEIFVDTPLAVVEARDPKGLYKKARRGELKNFTGIDSPYEAPEAPELHIETQKLSAEAAADAIFVHLRRRGCLDSIK